MAEMRLFLARRSYRRRRIMDAVRMLPFLCTVLWMLVPTMWPNGTDNAGTTPLSNALWYVFVIWALAITASFALWRRVRREDGIAEADAAKPDP